MVGDSGYPKSDFGVWKNKIKFGKKGEKSCSTCISYWYTAGTRNPPEFYV